jgi:hypothetical protein
MLRYMLRNLAAKGEQMKHLKYYKEVYRPNGTPVYVSIDGDLYPDDLPEMIKRLQNLVVLANSTKPAVEPGKETK